MRVPSSWFAFTRARVGSQHVDGPLRTLGDLPQTCMCTLSPGFIHGTCPLPGTLGKFSSVQQVFTERLLYAFDGAWHWECGNFKKKDLRSQFRGGGNLLNKGGKTRRVLGGCSRCAHTHTHTHTYMSTLTISIGTFPLSLLHTDAFLAFGLSTRLSHLPCLACLALWAWWWFILEKEPLPTLGCLPLLPLLPVTWPKVPSWRDFQRAHHQGRRRPKAKLAFMISGQSPLL